MKYEKSNVNYKEHIFANKVSDKKDQNLLEKH